MPAAVHTPALDRDDAAASWAGDAAGAVADLGVLLPIVAALAVVSGVSAGMALLVAAAASWYAGRQFGVPFPLQPIKAAAAIAIAGHLPAAQLSLAGLLLAGILAALAWTGSIDRLATWFAPPVVRGLQLGVGLLLLKAAIPLAGSHLAVAVLLAGALAVAASEASRVPVALLAFAGGVAWSLVHGVHEAAAGPLAAGGSLLATLTPATIWATLIALVVPQLPLTFGNAVVATTRLEHEYFGARAEAVTERAVALSCARMNVVSALVGGVPMCHGAGGLTAHYRAGARSARMNAIAAGVLATLGVAAFAGADLVSIVPAVVLAGFLAFTGVAHAALIGDQRGSDLAVALLTGAIGFATGNLAWGLAAGLLAAAMVRSPAAARPAA
jgi:hypothetical protein